MTERSRKRYAVGDVFADKDRDNEIFDCRSDVKFVLDSEDDSAYEESELDDSIIMPTQATAKM